MMAAFRTSVQQALFNGDLVLVLQGAKLVNPGEQQGAQSYFVIMR
jgi:hypothetical protein